MYSKLVLNIFLILAIAYMLAVRILLIFSYSIDLDGVEFVFVRHIQLLIDNKNVYTNPAEFPYASCLYVPGYLYLVKTIVCLFEKSLQENLHFVFVLARTISFVAFLTQTGLLILYLRKRFRVSWNAILILLFFYLMLISGHMYAVRPDALKFLFFTVSFFTLIEYEFFNQKIIYLCVSLLFAVLSVYFKQDMLVYQSIIIGMLFVFSRKPKYIVILIIFWLAVLGVYGLLLLVLGNYFFDSTVLLNFQKVNKPSGSINVIFMLFSAARIMPWLFLLWFFSRNEKQQFQDSVRYAIWVAVALFIVAHLLIMRAGSYINYGYETIFVALFVVAVGLPSIFSDTKNLRQLRFFILPYIAFLIAGNWVIHSYTYNFSKERSLKDVHFQNIRYANELKRIVQNEVVFFPDIRNVLYNRDLNLIYGYDYHLGRFISLIILKGAANVDTKLTFYDSKKYDDCFLNGMVKYIVSETAKDDHINKYYPKFLPYKAVGNLTVYRSQ